jgi:hypothetical protein
MRNLSYVEELCYSLLRKITFLSYHLLHGACGSVVVKALRYMSEVPGVDSSGFFPWHLTVPCALRSTQPLKMSTRSILGVTATGA